MSGVAVRRPGTLAPAPEGEDLAHRLRLIGTLETLEELQGYWQGVSVACRSVADDERVALLRREAQLRRAAERRRP